MKIARAILRRGLGYDTFPHPRIALFWRASNVDLLSDCGRAGLWPSLAQNARLDSGSVVAAGVG